MLFTSTSLATSSVMSVQLLIVLWVHVANKEMMQRGHVMVNINYVVHDSSVMHIHTFQHQHVMSLTQLFNINIFNLLSLSTSVFGWISSSLSGYHFTTGHLTEDLKWRTLSFAMGLVFGWDPRLFASATARSHQKNEQETKVSSSRLKWGYSHKCDTYARKSCDH